MTQTNITLDGTAQQIVGGQVLARRIRVEPATANAHRVYLGTSAVAADGSAGTIKVLAAPNTPAVTYIFDAYEENCGGAMKGIYVNEYYVRGTNTEHVNVTYWS